MKKVGVASLQCERIKKTIGTAAPDYSEVLAHSDMKAAVKVKSGQLDYYVGVYSTGADAALSIAVAIIGCNKSCTITRPDIKARDEHITKMVTEGKVTFDPSVEHTRHVIPTLVNHLKQKA